MYLFSFKKYAGHDRVFYSSSSFGHSGDLLETQDDFLLNLGEEVAFPESYTYQFPEQSVKVLYPSFFDQHFLSFLHWMVYEWYSSYKNVIKYFVSMEMQELLLRESRLSRSPKLGSSSLQWRDVKGQTLIILPDNWTRYNMLSPEQLSSSEMINLISTDTQNRKDLNRRMIKKSIGSIIIATQSEVFQPFRNLKKILFVDPHKWYYNNQQDPRYSLPTVVHKMGEIYGATVTEIKFKETLAFPI